MDDEMQQEEEISETPSFSLTDELVETFSSPLNIILLIIVAYFVYTLYFSKKQTEERPAPIKRIPPLKKQDMTPQELRKYDGLNEDGRVCMAVNGKIFDVTKGRQFYGPGGPYQAFAGRDATRGFATFSVEVTSEEYDDLSDLNSMQMEGVREWEMQFEEKYERVGRLLKPGEEPIDYSDDEDNSVERENTSEEGVKEENTSEGVKEKNTSEGEVKKEN